MREAFAKHKVLSVLVVLLLLTNLFLVFFIVMKKPAPPGRGSHPSRGEVMQLLEKEVGFSKDQLESYRQLKEQHWDRMKPSFTGMRNAKDGFYKLLSLSSVPDSVVNAMADTIAARQKQIDLQTFRHFQQVRALCTPEQQPRFDSVVQLVLKKMNGPWRKGPPKVDSTRRQPAPDR
ncbi:Spy/CpxP family protein refolding chaperone [Chitinophaga rhizosphaerae]|uniref:Spy/CpxP family protein refolding chaperone n=1 Tax=Chitinophaga rhizosphaerae TaxID=1864947 RepID=UPI000F814D37|nr:periplasmic heavy metal sensor [Chitinophaga rhizosphaerae]